MLLFTILPNEILLDIIDYLPFEGAINLFKTESIRDLFDRKIRDETLYRKLFLNVTCILDPSDHYEKEEFIMDSESIEECKQEILTLMRKNLDKNSIIKLMSFIRESYVADNEADNLWHIAKEGDYYLKEDKYEKLRSDINTIFNWHVNKILNTKNPREITSYINKTYYENRDLIESYMDGIEEILSVDYK